MKMLDNRLVLYSLIIITTQAMPAPYFYINWTISLLVLIKTIISVMLRNKVNLRVLKTLFFSIAWLLVPFIMTLLFSPINPKQQWKYMLLNIFYSAISIVIIDEFYNDKQRNQHILLLNKIWIIISLLSYLSFRIKLLRTNIYTDFSGVVVNRNTFSIISTLLISYLVYYKNEYKNKSTINIMIIISFFLVFSTSSIKGVVGWFMIFLLSSKRNYHGTKFNKMRLIRIIFLGVFILFLIRVENNFTSRVIRFIMVFTSPENLNKSESAYLRSYFIKESIDIIKTNPLTGIGIANSIYYLVPPKTTQINTFIGTYSHNNYLEILLGGGILSFLIYYSPIIYTYFKYSKRMNNNLKGPSYVNIIIIYKLFIDFASVSYDNLVLIFIYCSIVYFGTLRIRRILKDEKNIEKY